jgi:sporulation protein YlmC with PRC-barrel domain
MTHTLVASDRVEGALVYGRDGERIGTIERLMLDKRTGVVAYAVVKCGGVLAGERHHYPIPWSSLKFDPARKAFEAVSTLDELRGGPSELDGETFDWGDRAPAYRHPQYWTV